MRRRDFLKACLLGPALAVRALAGKGRRPNILFIMSDDHACNTIGAYGSRLVPTPHIDRIAREGAILANSFCANSICSPSRATILTGVHSHVNGVTHNGAPWDGSQTVYSRLLGRAGYQTVLIGKWHQKPPTPTDEVGHWDVLIGHGGQGSYHDPLFATKGGETRVKGYSTDIATDKAIAWLEKERDPKKPFLLMVQFKSPHVPRQPPPRHFDRVKPEDIPLPPTFFDDYKGRAPYAATAWMKVWDGRPARADAYPKPRWGGPEPRVQPGEQESRWRDREKFRNAEFHRRFAAGEFKDGRKYGAYRYRRAMQDYLGCVAAVDENVGRLLKWVDDSGLAKDTVVVYASDQSYFVGEHGWMEKRWMYEEALRMPFVIRWPGTIEPGARVEELVQNIDYAPTFLQMAGVAIPERMQGKSFLPLLRGDVGREWRECIYYHYYHHGAHNVPRHDGVRTARYKLMHFYTDDVYEMFDLEKDPHELRSVYEDAAYANVRRDLLRRLADLRRQYGVPDHVFRHPYVHLSRAERAKGKGRK